MTSGVGKLFARKKQDGAAADGVDVSAEQRAASKGLFGRVTRGEGTAGTPQAPTGAPSDIPSEAVEAPVATADLPSGVEVPASPSVVAPVPSAQEKVAEEVEGAEDDVWTDDALALVAGESDVGLLGEKLSTEQLGLYQSEEPHPVKLFEALSRDFNRLEWTVWEPEALAVEILEHSGRVPSEVVRNMAGALASLVESEAFWNEHHVFLWTAQALNGQVPNFAILPDLAPEEVTFAVGVAGVIRDHEDLQLPDGTRIPGVQLGDQVVATIAAIWHTSGLIYAPEPLEAVNEHLARLHDRPIRTLAAEVEAAWGSMGSGDPDDEDSALGLQIIRLAAIREYVRNPHE